MLVEISEPPKGNARQFSLGGETAGSFISDLASGVANAASSVAQGAINAFDKAQQGNVANQVFGQGQQSTNTGSGNMGNSG